MGFLKKTFKKIKKGIKKVISKVGKVFNKLGPLGTIALMIAAPYASNAMFGTNFSTLTSRVAGQGLEKGLEKGVEKGLEKGVEKTATDAFRTELLTGRNHISQSITDVMTNVADYSDALSPIKPTFPEPTLLAKTGKFVKDVGTGVKEHYQDLFTPESLKEGAVDLAVAGTEAAILGAGGEDYSQPRSGVVQPRINIGQAQDAYVQAYGPSISQATGQPIKNYQDVTNSLIYGNITPDFISAFSQPMYMQPGVAS